MAAMKRRMTKLNAMLVLVAMLVLWAGVAPFLAARLIVAKPMARADAILVLGGSATYFPRATEAAFLYKEGVAPSVLLTNDGELAGWVSSEQRTPPFVELTKQRLVAQGVPETAIETLSPPVSGTIDEARLLGQKAASRHWRSVVIVTSAYHTRRALRTFEREFAANGVDTRIGIVPALDGRHEAPAAYWWLTARGLRDVAGEYIKSAYYFLAY